MRPAKLAYQSRGVRDSARHTLLTLGIPIAPERALTPFPAFLLPSPAIYLQRVRSGRSARGVKTYSGQPRGTQLDQAPSGLGAA